MRVYITRYSRHLALLEHVVCCSFGNTAGNLFLTHRHPKLEIRALLRNKSHLTHYGSCAYINFETLGSVQGETIAYVTYYAYDEIY